MKRIISLVCMFCTIGAYGQATAGVGALNSQPVVIQLPSHQQHASVQSLGREQNLLQNSGMSFGRGERPLWEVMHPKEPVPLGDIARQLRKEHEAAKKATFVKQD